MFITDVRATAVVQVIPKVQMAWASSSSGFEKLQEKTESTDKKKKEVLITCALFQHLKNCPLCYTAAKESNDSFWGDQRSQIENLMSSFSVTSKETLDSS